MEESFTYYTIDSFPYASFKAYLEENRIKRNNARAAYNIICAFDSETSHDTRGDEYINMYEAERNYISGHKIIVPDYIKDNVDEYNEIRKRCFAQRLYLSSKGIRISELYDNLVSLFGWDDLNNEIDQFLAITNFMIDTAPDIEDSQEIAWVYSWACTLDDYIVFGRYPSEFVAFMDKINELIEDDTLLYIGVHNLSYDYTFFRPWLIDSYGKPDKEFWMSPHKCIYAEVGNFRLYDTLILSNRSLRKWGKDLGVEHIKRLEPKQYYSEILYPDSELTEENIQYQIIDVVSLKECIRAQLDLFGDRYIWEAPLTSTGYGRRDMKRYYDEYNRDNKNAALWEFQRSKLTPLMYQRNKEAFKGGFVHGNEDYRDETKKGNGKHADFRSHYPTQLRIRKYPRGKFLKRNIKNLSDIWKENKLSIITVILEDGELKDHDNPVPFLMVSDLENGVEIRNKAGQIIRPRILPKNIVRDNGRALAFKGSVALTFTDVDLSIIFDEYKFKSVSIYLCMTADADYLPEWFIKCMDYYYKLKSDLKDRVKYLKKIGAPDYEIIDADSTLTKIKNLLNGLYGMCATDIIKPQTIADLEGEFLDPEYMPIAEALERYYKSGNKRYYNKNFLSPQWGTFVTAYARLELYQMAKMIDQEGGKWTGKHFLYSDTDSIFFLDDEADTIEAKIDKINKKWEAEAIEKGWYIINEKGDKVVYHQFELEKERITAFRFLHSKCYAFEDQDGLHATIAGVQKEIFEGNYTADGKPIFFHNSDELETIERLTPGTVFKKCGGTKIKYIPGRAYTDKINGHYIESGACAILTNNEKTLHNGIFDDIDEIENLFTESEGY